MPDEYTVMCGIQPVSPLAKRLYECDRERYTFAAAKR